MEFVYFENINGTIFRRPAGPQWEGMGVHEIWTGGRWQPYTSDALKPVGFGNRITEADLPPEARASKGKVVELTVRRRRKAFQIVGAKTPPTR